MKKIIFLLLLIVFSVSLVGCTSKIEEKVFSGGGVSIKLTSDFQEYEHDRWDYYLYNSQSIAFMVKRYTRHQTLQGVDLSELNMEGYMKFCMVTNEFDATIFHVERPLDMFDPFVYCYFTDVNDKYGYMMIVMCDEDYFYNINLSTTYEDFQESKQLLMEYAVTIKIG